jgi:hypothetical protein
LCGPGGMVERQCTQAHPHLLSQPFLLTACSNKPHTCLGPCIQPISHLMLGWRCQAATICCHHHVPVGDLTLQAQANTGATAAYNRHLLRHPAAEQTRQNVVVPAYRNVIGAGPVAAGPLAVCHGTSSTRACLQAALHTHPTHLLPCCCRCEQLPDPGMRKAPTPTTVTHAGCVACMVNSPTGGTTNT